MIESIAIGENNKLVVGISKVGVLFVDDIVGVLNRLANYTQVPSSELIHPDTDVSLLNIPVSMVCEHT